MLKENKQGKSGGEGKRPKESVGVYDLGDADKNRGGRREGHKKESGFGREYFFGKPIGKNDKKDVKAENWYAK